MLTAAGRPWPQPVRSPGATGQQSPESGLLQLQLVVCSQDFVGRSLGTIPREGSDLPGPPDQGFQWQTFFSSVLVYSNFLLVNFGHFMFS